MLGGVRWRVAEIVIREVAEDRAGLEAFEMRERVFGVGRAGGRDQDSRSEAANKGHDMIKSGDWKMTSAQARLLKHAPLYSADERRNLSWKNKGHA
jgi:hypothetical protein